MVGCDCGCEGDPARCICRDLNRNPPEVKLSKTQEAKYHHLTVTDPKGHKRLYSSYRLTPWRGSSNVLVRYGIRKAPGPRGGMTGKVAFLFPATEFTLAQAKAWVASPSHGGPHEVYKIRVSRKKPAKKKAKKRKRAAG
jgi:hypothetical protein